MLQQRPLTRHMAAFAVYSFLGDGGEMTGATRLMEVVAARMLAMTETIPSVIYRVLLPHERQVSSTRQHPAVLVGPCLLVAAGFVAAVVLTVLVADGGTNVLLVVWFAWLVLVLRLIVKTLDWLDSYFVVTSARIIMVTGSFRRKVDIIPLGIVNDITIGTTLGGNLFGCADFTISCGAPDQIIYKIAYLPDAQRIFFRISSAIFQQESVPCPLCNGEGTAFQPPGAGNTNTLEPADEDSKPRIRYMNPLDRYLAPGDDVDESALLGTGYMETECPQCQGRGTIPKVEIESD